MPLMPLMPLMPPIYAADLKLGHYTAPLSHAQ